MKIHRTEEVVRYHETDRMGTAHHTVFLVWFELARTSLIKASGQSYREMERNGTLLPVIEYSCRLTGNAGYDERVSIETWIAELRSRTIVFAYRALHDGRLIAEGRTKHLCVDEDNRYRRIPEEIARSLRQYAEG